MKEGLVQYERLINVKKLKGLNEVSGENGTIKIGALCTHHQLENSSLLQQKLPSLVKLEQNVANVRVRQVGSIGCNLCFAEPHADPGTLLMHWRMIAAKAPASARCCREFFCRRETSLPRIGCSKSATWRQYVVRISNSVPRTERRYRCSCDGAPSATSRSRSAAPVPPKRCRSRNLTQQQS
jgi:hypothetical protein